MKGRVYVEIVVLNKRWFFAGMPDIEKLVRWMDANATQSELLPPILRNGEPATIEAPSPPAASDPSAS